MEMQGETLIAAPRSAVWKALNDPAVLARCIDGVESLEAAGDNRFAGVLNAKVGPVRAKFSGEVELTELDPPNRYVLVGEGKGGVAGFAKGSAEVTLEDAPNDEGVAATRLRYLARSTVGGKLAQLGSRLIEGAARGYAESFFEKFKAEVERPTEPAAEPMIAADGAMDAGLAAETVATEPSPRIEEPAMPAAPTEEAATGGVSPLVWGSALVILTIILLVYLLGGWPF